MDSVNAVPDLFPGRAESMRIGLDVKVRLERISGNDLVGRLPFLLEKLSTGGAELPDLAQVRPHDFDQLRAFERAFDATLLATHGDRILLVGPKNQERSISVARDGFGGAAGDGKACQ